MSKDDRELTVDDAVSAIASYCREMKKGGKEPRFSDLPGVLRTAAATRPNGAAMSKDDRELIEAPAPITPDDAPHWLKGWTPEFYAKQHNEQIGQMVREVSIAGGAGGTAVDWVRLAKDYLRTIADNSPPQGGLHHSLRIVTEQLSKVATRLEALQAQPVALPLLSSAFRTTVSGAGGYSMHFKFPTMAALHAADDEWIKFRKDGQCTDGFAKSADGSTPNEATSASITTADAAALTASPPVVERESVIDRALVVAVEDAINEPPHSYGSEPMEVRDYRHSLYRIWTPLRDAILALTPVEGVGVIDWRRIEDAIFEGLDANISCTQNKVRDLAKLLTARVTALSTPVAQGDEVREALEGYKTEYGWLIELDGPQGLSYCMGSKFDPDHANALRFARREDAQAFCDQFSVTYSRIAQHGWD